MAVYKIFPEKDTFISTEVPTGNAGKDEIVELGGYIDISGVGETNRILVKYNTSDITTALALIGTASYQANLHTYLADASALPSDTTVYVNALAESWDNGTGKFGDTPINTTGVSWNYRLSGEAGAWTTSGYAAGTTGSYKSDKPGGGTWYIQSGSSQTYSVSSKTFDIDVPVTAAVAAISSSTIVNNGFILRLQPDLEFNTTASIRLRYFGADTNTIYPPSLDFKWDDSTYNTGSLSVLNTSIVTIGIANNRGTYSDVGKQRFRLTAKPKYPTRSFATTSVYLVNYALPSGSYWGLRDENTQEMVVDYDTNYTKVSCDSTGPYFDVYMDGLQPERYYRILVKSTLDGSTTVIDNNNVFKVVRNG